MKYSKTLNILLISLFFIGCTATSENNDENNEEDEIEELTEFGILLQDKFEKKELPYTCNRTFENYNPDGYLSEDEFKKLELFMIFPEYENKRYSAEDRIILDNGITVVIVTSKDNNEELSTYAVTYDKDEWYVANIRVGYEHSLIDLTISSVIDGDQIDRKIIEEYQGDRIVEEETYYIRGDGTIDWEKDIIGDDIQ